MYVRMYIYVYIYVNIRFVRNLACLLRMEGNNYFFLFSYGNNTSEIEGNAKLEMTIIIADGGHYLVANLVLLPEETIGCVSSSSPDRRRVYT